MTKLKMFLPFGMSLKKGQTLEARFARTMDHFKPLLKNASNYGGTWVEFIVSYDKVYAKKKVIAEGSENIRAYA